METHDSPASQFAKASPERHYNTRLGLSLFVVYLLLYVGFVLVNAFAANVMDTTVVAGLNLAIVYGFGLIITALVMALLYGLLCKTETTSSGVNDSEVNESEVGQ